MMGGRSTRDYGDRDRPSLVDEDPNRWNSARGSKFVPSEPTSQSSFGGGRRDFSNQSDRSEPRDYGNFERGSKFTPSASGTTSPSGMESRRSSYMASSTGPSSLAPSEADNASVWRRAAPLPSQPTSPNPEAPTERKRLALAPRTQSSATVTSPTSATSSKPNPFGSAAPVDTAEKERAIEAKLEKLRLEAQEKANAAPVRSSAFANRASSTEKTVEKKEEPAKQPTKIMSNPQRREGLSFANAAGANEEAKPVVPAEEVKEEEQKE